MNTQPPQINTVPLINVLMQPSEMHSMLYQSQVGEKWLCMLNVCGAPILHQQFFEQGSTCDYSSLFAGTAYEHMLEYSPYCIFLDKNSPFLQTLQASTENWGFIAVSQAPAKDILRHWQSLLTALFPNGDLTHLRFYSTSVLYKLLCACIESEAIELLGPHTCLLLPENGAWRFIHSQNQSSNKQPEYNIRPANIPWWQLTQAQVAIFDDILESTLLSNLEEYLWYTHSQATFVLYERGVLQENIKQHVHHARGYGWKRNDHIQKYVEHCVMHGTAHEAPQYYKAITASVAENPEHALALLETLGA